MSDRSADSAPWRLALCLVLGLSPIAGPADAASDLAARVRAAAAGPRAPLFAFEELRNRPRVRQVELSPAGERVAYLLAEHAGTSLWVHDPLRGDTEHRLTSRSVERFAWSTDGGGLFLETATRVAFLRLAGGRPELVVRLDPQREQRLRGVDPSRPRHLLISETAPRGEHRVLRVASDGTPEVVLASSQPIHAFLLDASGRPTFVVEPAGSHLVVRRAAAEGDGVVYRCPFLDACRPLALGRDGTELLLRSRGDGDLLRLLGVDLATGAVREVHRDPEGIADLAGLTLDPVERSPLTATYLTGRERQYAVDPRVAAGLERIEHRFPAADIHVEARLGGRHWLVEERGPKLQHPRYHLFDTDRGALAPFLATQRLEGDPLPTEVLADRLGLTYRASDGLRIHAFLTVPQGVEPSRAPVVVVLHGGPWTQARPGWSDVAQALANRGYLIFEPNFRASTGYGLAHVLAGRGEFGDGRVLQDVVDGLGFLDSLGIGDRDRVAVVGHSFGGFSTLAALAFTPQRFRAGVASAPPIDLVRALRDIDPTLVLSHGIEQREIVERLLVDLDDPQALAELESRSPERHLGRTARPLLLMAGGSDDRVDVVDVKHYAAELRGLDKDVSLFVDDTAGHSFDRPRLARTWFHLTERFLAHHLGGAMGPAPGPRTLAYLEENLRLTGDSLARALAPPAPPP